MRRTETIALRADGVEGLFDAFDPSPFRERALHPGAAGYILDQAAEAPAGTAFALRVELPAAEAARPEAARLPGDLAACFAGRAKAAGRRLRETLRTGRTALLIGLVAFAATLVAAQVAPVLLPPRLGRFAEESLVVLGWVVMWRPLEIYLYEWWPILREKRLHERLAAADVRVVAADRRG